MTSTPMTTDLASTIVAHTSHAPFISIQCDWNHTRDGTFWVSSTGDGAETVEGECAVDASAGMYRVTPPSFTIIPTTTIVDTVIVTNTDTGADYAVQAPSTTLTNVHPSKQPVLSVAVNPVNPAHILTGSTDGSVVAYDWADDRVVAVLDSNGHVGDVDIVEYFPSGFVALTAALDLTLKVWSVEAGKCALTLSGHQQRVTGVSLVGNGRQFVTSSLDSSIKLWDTSVGKSIGECGFPSTSRSNDRQCNDCLVISDSDVIASVDSVVMGAYSDGVIRGFDLRAPSAKSILAINTGNEVTTLTQCQSHSLTAGLASGHCVSIELRRCQPIRVWRRERDSAVTAMIGDGSDSVWTADALGAVTHWAFDADTDSGINVRIDKELSGIDCEPVRAMAASYAADGKARTIFTAADAIRVYQV